MRGRSFSGIDRGWTNGWSRHGGKEESWEFGKNEPASRILRIRTSDLLSDLGLTRGDDEGISSRRSCWNGREDQIFDQISLVRHASGRYGNDDSFEEARAVSRHKTRSS